MPTSKLLRRVTPEKMLPIMSTARSSDPGGVGEQQVRPTLLKWARTIVFLATCTSFGTASLHSELAQAKTNDSSPESKAAALLGKPAPDFVVTALDGRHVSLADYKGKALLVNFWATWCGNCRLEMPWLAQLREQYAAHGFEVLAF